MKNIEVEIRSLIPEDKYEELLSFLHKNAKFLGEDYQETYYLDAKEDLRIQKNNAHTKIWLKKGKMHDDFREEIEINFEESDFEKIEQLFSVLGYKTKIKWFRTRNEFSYKDVKIDLDYTRGYGHIIELEIMTDEAGKEGAHKTLQELMSELNVDMTEKEEFERKFINYEKNWETLTKD